MGRELQVPTVNPDNKASKFVYAVEVTIYSDHPEALPTADQVEDVMKAGFEFANKAARTIVDDCWDVAFVQITNEPNIDAVS